MCGFYCLAFIEYMLAETFTAQKMNFSIKDFLSKHDQICSFMRIWSHLLKKSLMENFIFRAVFNRFHQFIFSKDYKKNYKIIYKCFKDKYGRRSKS